MSNAFRYAVYGTGRIGRVHADIVRSQGCDVVAVGDDVAAAAEIARKELDIGGDAVFTDAEEMAAAVTDDVDGVIIASHTRDHARHAAAFLAEGLNVYVEKPITDDLAESFDLISSLDPDGPDVQIGLQRRFDPALCHARSLIEEGHLGEIREIRSALRDQFPPPETYQSRGLIIDMGIHVADEVRFLVDEFPLEIWASLHRTVGYRSNVDEGGDTAFVSMTFPSGAIGRLDLSRTHASGYNNETYVIGTEGTLHVGRFAGYPGPVPVELWTSAGELHPASQVFEMAQPEGDYPEFLPRFDQAYRLAHEDFREALADKRPFRVTANDALDAQVLVEAAHRSALAGRSRVTVLRPSDIDAYRATCEASGLL
ncbi:MAG: Gfo/Idh/MocA family oxidoreductase [Actinomycetota bacterium]